MARNREFDDTLDELKMLHDVKNHDYATEENPYKNLEGVSRIGIEPWRGIVIRLMDKFERVEQYCRSGEFAVKGEGLEDTFKDISIYSALALILFRKGQEKDQELTEFERGKGSTDYGEPRFMSPKHLEPVDDKYNGDESFTHPIIAMRESAEEQAKGESSEEQLIAMRKSLEKEGSRWDEAKMEKMYNLMQDEEREYWLKKARDNQ